MNRTPQRGDLLKEARGEEKAQGKLWIIQTRVKIRKRSYATHVLEKKNLNQGGGGAAGVGTDY